MDESEEEKNNRIFVGVKETSAAADADAGKIPAVSAESGYISLNETLASATDVAEIRKVESEVVPNNLEDADN